MCEHEESVITRAYLHRVVDKMQTIPLLRVRVSGVQNCTRQHSTPAQCESRFPCHLPLRVFSHAHVLPPLIRSRQRVRPTALKCVGMLFATMYTMKTRGHHAQRRRRRTGLNNDRRACARVFASLCVCDGFMRSCVTACCGTVHWHWPTNGLGGGRPPPLTTPLGRHFGK